MEEEFYMQRCLDLATLAAGKVAPNPLVGAVLVCDDRIIGEGFHREFGKAHAEVNCLQNVKPEDVALIAQSTLYVSLEPCSHFGKTPPCVDLIIRHQIKKVVIGTQDIFAKVNGEGIRKLKNAGIEVVVGVKENECRKINKRFFCFHQNKRPFIVLKWAQTADGFIGNNHRQLFISNEISNRLVHRWRAEEAAILVGKNTVLVDNPSLTVRLNKGKNPVRLLIDGHLSIEENFSVFDDDAKTIIFNQYKSEEKGSNIFAKINFGKNVEEQILKYCFDNEYQSILVEGGAKTLQHFIDKNLWDECRIITNRQLFAEAGVAAPTLKNAIFVNEENFLNDTIQYFERK